MFWSDVNCAIINTDNRAGWSCWSRSDPWCCCGRPEDSCPRPSFCICCKHDRREFWLVYHWVSYISRGTACRTACTTHPSLWGSVFQKTDELLGNSGLWKQIITSCKTLSTEIWIRWRDSFGTVFRHEVFLIEWSDGWTMVCDVIRELRKNVQWPDPLVGSLHDLLQSRHEKSTYLNWSLQWVLSDRRHPEEESYSETNKHR